MKAAYVDTSCLVGVAMNEPAGMRIRGRLMHFQKLVASNLLEAELRSAIQRMGVEQDPSNLLARVHWIHPDRPLTPELSLILAIDALRGADLWHLACALFVSPDPRQLSFLTLDQPQRAVAKQLGFTT